MVKVTFEYKDEFTKGNWREQSCICSSVEECKDWYNLGVDCEYRIKSVEKVEE